ncbi:uncharacterized protein LOC144134098 [Amblyomma americanum]
MHEGARGGSQPASIDPVSEQVGSIASHMATRIINEFDSDGAYQPAVESLPVVRLLQPMNDGPDDMEFDYADDLREDASHAGQSQPPAATANESGAPAAAPEGKEEIASPIVQPFSSTCNIAPLASGVATRCIPAAALASGDSSKAPKGRMALLEKTLDDENEVRAGLLREEHTLRLKLLQEDHDSILHERATKHKFLEQVQALELEKLKNELLKQEAELEILQMEKKIKEQQLCKALCSKAPQG